MNKEQELNKLIKTAIAQKANEVQVQEYLFLKIKSGMEATPSPGPGNRFRWFTGCYGWNLNGRLAVIPVILILCALVFVFSKDVQILTGEVLAAVKSIFVVEETGDGYQVVEKPAAEVDLFSCVSKTTLLSDTELTKKVDFSVHFPSSLAANYTLLDKGLTIGLRKPINYNLTQKIQTIMEKAIEDETEFKKLKKYRPQWSVFGIYKNDQGQNIFIHTERIQKSAFSKKAEQVRIGGIKGIWSAISVPEYPLKTENDIGSEDMTRKPSAIRTKHSLAWEAGGLSYQISSPGEQDLVLDEAVQIAASFMKHQKDVKQEAGK